jgi:hypothetical protein
VSSLARIQVSLLLAVLFLSVCRLKNVFTVCSSGNIYSMCKAYCQSRTCKTDYGWCFLPYFIRTAESLWTDVGLTAAKFKRLILPVYGFVLSYTATNSGIFVILDDSACCLHNCVIKSYVWKFWKPHAIHRSLCLTVGTDTKRELQEGDQ